MKIKVGNITDNWIMFLNVRVIAEYEPAVFTLQFRYDKIVIDSAKVITALIS